MSEMVERVARAMEARSAIEPVTIEDVARSAIEAMREPTEGMVDATQELIRGQKPFSTIGMWQAMIDEALK
jgi:hypothetical protein